MGEKLLSEGVTARVLALLALAESANGYFLAKSFETSVKTMAVAVIFGLTSIAYACIDRSK